MAQSTPAVICLLHLLDTPSSGIMVSDPAASASGSKPLLGKLHQFNLIDVMTSAHILHAVQMITQASAGTPVTGVFNRDVSFQISLRAEASFKNAGFRLRTTLRSACKTIPDPCRGYILCKPQARTALSAPLSRELATIFRLSGHFRLCPLRRL